MHFLRLSVAAMSALTLATTIPVTSSAQCSPGGGRSMMGMSGNPGMQGMSASPMAMQSMMAARQMQMQAAMLQQAQLQAAQFQANQFASLQSASVAAAKQGVALRQLAARLSRFSDAQLRVNVQRSPNPIVRMAASNELVRRQRSTQGQQNLAALAGR